MALRQLHHRDPYGTRRPADACRALLEEGVYEYDEMMAMRREQEHRERRYRSLQVAVQFHLLVLGRGSLGSLGLGARVRAADARPVVRKPFTFGPRYASRT